MKRTEALEGFQFPKTQTQVRSFLGLCNVYRRFVKGFAKVAAPLNDLLKKGCPDDVTRTVGRAEEVLSRFEARAS